MPYFTLNITLSITYGELSVERKYAGRYVNTPDHSSVVIKWEPWEASMRSCVSTLAIISLFNPTWLVAPKTSHSEQAEFAPASQYLVQDTIQTQIPPSCPVTKPPTPPFVAPSPYPSQASPDGFWFGSKKLWTQLPKGGTWDHLPHARPNYTAFSQKLFWWRQGYDVFAEPQPKLTVTGKRLDSSAPTVLLADHASNGWVQRDQPFMVVGIDIPALGCWKITGHYQDEELSFVIWVAQ